MCPLSLCLGLLLLQVSRKEMQSTLSLRFGGEGILKVKGIPFKVRRWKCPFGMPNE